MDPKKILGKTAEDIEAEYPNRFITEDIALDSSYKDMALSAKDNSCEIFFGDSEFALQITYDLKESIPRVLKIESGMSREQVLSIMGEPAKYSEPKSLVVFGGERGGGSILYRESGLDIGISTSYPEELVFRVTVTRTEASE